MSTVVSRDSGKKAQKRQARQSRPLAATEMSAVVSRDSELVKSIPFDDIVAGATVRFAEIDGVQYLSIRDIVMHVCNKDSNHAADWWRTLAEEKKNELTQFLGFFRSPGSSGCRYKKRTHPIFGYFQVPWNPPTGAARDHVSWCHQATHVPSG